MKRLLLFAALLACSPHALATVYKCVGENGRISYQANACAAGVVLPIDEAQPPLAPPPSVASAPFRSQSGGGHRRIARSQSQKNRFKAFHPCPANGEPSGPCPGYVVDHIKPLACGGADDPGNMQWQTVAAGKAKDAWERKGCQTASRAYR
ncbi:MAG: DUF4124 domain-containing protein [Candidatus Methylumidiphilus sp.]